MACDVLRVHREKATPHPEKNKNPEYIDPIPSNKVLNEALFPSIEIAFFFLKMSGFDQIC